MNETAPKPDPAALLPCPFCGGGETQTKEQRTSPTMDGRSSLIGVHIRHWCEGLTKGAQRLIIEVHGRDHADAIAAWNTRAALRPEPSPIRTKLPSPCDDEALERELVEAVKIARTSDAKYVSDILDATSVLNIVLQITEGSDILDRLIERHLNDHFATLADATAQVIERDFPELKPQPSPDDAAVLDEYADAFAEWKHIESEYAETSPNYVAAKARFEEASAAVLARMDRRAVIAECVAALKAKQKMLIDVGCDGPVVNAFSSAMGVIRALADKEA